MTLEPHLITTAALTMAIGYTMLFSGIKKHTLEPKRPKRFCPSCGRALTGRVCREH